MKISVIIPTLNRLESLSRTLHFMEKCESGPDEIIVVDQTQKEDAILIEHMCNTISLNIKYINNVEKSLTKARNTGLGYASGDIVVFSDDDVDVKKDTFVNIRNLFDDERVSMVAGVNEGDICSHNSFFSYLLGMASYKKRRIGHVSSACYGRFPLSCQIKTRTEWAMGFFFAVRNNLLCEWGLLFDEKLKYYAYAEDLDFSYRFYQKAKESGLICIMSSLLEVKHNISKEFRIPQRKTTFMMILHRYYLTKKLLPSYCSFVYYWCNFGILVDSIKQKKYFNDVFDAMFFCFRHKDDIIGGDFLYEEWMK